MPAKRCVPEPGILILHAKPLPLIGKAYTEGRFQMHKHHPDCEPGKHHAHCNHPEHHHPHHTPLKEPVHVAPRPPVAKPHVEKPYNVVPALVIGGLIAALMVALIWYMAV